LSSSDLLRQVVVDFGIKDAKTTRGEILAQLNDFLIDAYRRSSTAVLLVDEAHLLTAELLEEIRLLTNIETAQHKLLQIVLVGQPELDDLLDSPFLRQLKQRVALRCRLEPLADSDVHGYIDKRLQLAGAPGRLLEIFPPETLSRIVSYSRGIPRLINTICDSALINGYAQQEKWIRPSVIEEIASDLRLRVTSVPPSPPTPQSDIGNPADRKLMVAVLLKIARLLDPAADLPPQSH
jgi:type II secretory pathway predicted ATPase ExeA